MDNLKASWRGAKFHTSSNEEPDNNRKTALARLAAHYRRFSLIALSLTLCMPMWLWGAMRNESGLGLRFRLGVVLFGILYLLTASSMDWWLYKGISRIDVATMSVSEVCRRTFYYRKKHSQFMGILLPLALLFIGNLTWLLSGDIWFVYGIVAGALVGVAFGIRQFMQFMAEYRDITK